MERLFHAKRREIGIGCLDFGSMFNSFQLQHDATAAVFSLASSPSGVDMLDCKLNGSENRRMEIEQNIPKQKKKQKLYYSDSFITFYYHILTNGMNLHNGPTASWVVLLFTCVV